MSALRIAILSRNRNLHSIRRLLQEARKARIAVDVINPLDCQLVVDGPGSHLLMAGRQTPLYDAVLPRIGASITDYGVSVVRQFETMGMYVVNGSRAIAESRDKLSGLQVLSGAGLRVPSTVLSRTQRGMRMALPALGDFPVVLKLLEGTQGVGVMLLHTPISLGSVVEALHGLGQDVLLQKFIREGAGRDYRVFVVGNRVVASMERTAPEGEFRSNIHRGGVGRIVKLPREFERTALVAAKTLGLEIAGVDLMADHRGPLVIEVNSSPGFEGLEAATGANIAREIIRHIAGQARAWKRRGKRDRDRTKKRPGRNGPGRSKN